MHADFFGLSKLPSYLLAGQFRRRKIICLEAAFLNPKQTKQKKKKEKKKRINKKIIFEQYISVAVVILLYGDYEDLLNHKCQLYYLRYCPVACWTPAAD